MTKLISLCMIVKNEETVLDRCLQSVHQWVDEIVILDTGSTDATKTIAQKYTDKIYDFIWINDFSAARNEALKHATAQWILVLDADEYMNENDIRGLHDFLYHESPKNNIVYHLSAVSFLGDNTAASTSENMVGRIFANHMGIEYSRPIHEQPMSSKLLTLKAANVPFRIYHTGYLDESIQNNNKHDRNMLIFNEMNQQGNWVPYDHFMLGNQHMMMKNFEQASKHYQIALTTGNHHEIWYKYNLMSLVDLYINTNKNIEAWNFTEKYLSPYLQYPDIRCLRGIILQNLGFLEDAKSEFLTAFQESATKAQNNQNVSIVSPVLSLKMPLVQLVNIYEREKDFPQCVYYLTKLILLNDKDIESKIKLIEILSLNETTESIVSFMDKLLNVGDDLPKTAKLGKIAVSLGNRELAQHYFVQGQLTTVLKTYDLLRYSLLCNKQTDFEQILSESSKEQLEHALAIKHLILGAIVWNQPEWLNRVSLSKDHESFNHMKLAFALLGNESSEDNAKPEDITFDLLTELFILQHFDAFDLLMNRCSTPNLINRLANFFYSKHLDSTAIQYYSYLLENQLLSAESCVNLAFLHFNQQCIEDALPFLEQAITFKPKSKTLYIQYCLNCQDRHIKKEMKQKLLLIEPQYNELSLFHTL